MSRHSGEIGTVKKATNKPKPQGLSKNTSQQIIWIRPAQYQPTRAEIEEDMGINTTPEKLAKSALQVFDIKIIGKDKKWGDCDSSI